MDIDLPLIDNGNAGANVSSFTELEQKASLSEEKEITFDISSNSEKLDKEADITESSLYISACDVSPNSSIDFTKKDKNDSLYLTDKFEIESLIRGKENLDMPQVTTLVGENDSILDNALADALDQTLLNSSKPNTKEMQITENSSFHEAFESLDKSSQENNFLDHQNEITTKSTKNLTSKIPTISDNTETEFSVDKLSDVNQYIDEGEGVNILELDLARKADEVECFISKLSYPEESDKDENILPLLDNKYSRHLTLESTKDILSPIYEEKSPSIELDTNSPGLMNSVFLTDSSNGQAMHVLSSNINFPSSPSKNLRKLEVKKHSRVKPQTDIPTKDRKDTEVDKNFEALKRKLDEMLVNAEQEENTAVKYLVKMKNEKLQIFDEIMDEINRIKLKYEF